MINVLFFARLREQLQCEKLTLEYNDIRPINDDITIAALKAHLISLHPTWLPHFENTTLLSAINQSMVDESAMINKDDEIAFFPPVTGG